MVKVGVVAVVEAAVDAAAIVTGDAVTDVVVVVAAAHASDAATPRSQRLKLMT